MPGLLQLAGRLAIVTGGASGIGKAICTRLVQDGAKVAVADIVSTDAQRERLAAVVADLGASAHAFPVDVSKHDQVKTMMEDISVVFNEDPNICVNCAGITRDVFLNKMTLAAWDDVIDVNLKGTFLVTQAVAQRMEEGKVQNASIINVASIIAKTGNMSQASYAASKAGVVGFTKSVAKELGRSHIRVNAILPGFIVTPMTDIVPDKLLQKLMPQIALRRLGQPHEVADLVAFLASDQSSYITGAAIEISGGLGM